MTSYDDVITHFHDCNFPNVMWRIKNTIQYNAIRYDTIQYNAIQYNAMQYNTIQYNTMQCNTIQCNAIQCNTIQYNTIQYNTIQYNTIQYNTIQYLHRRSKHAGNVVAWGEPMQVNQYHILQPLYIWFSRLTLVVRAAAVVTVAAARICRVVVVRVVADMEVGVDETAVSCFGCVMWVDDWAGLADRQAAERATAGD